jgi:hypothetical protein
VKTHIIHLEVHDDINSTMDKMSWSKSARILIVLPEKEKMIRTRLEIIQLQRRARKIGAILALVTQDVEITNLAREQGVPIFRFVSQAQKSPWRRGRRSRRAMIRSYWQLEKKNRSLALIHRPSIQKLNNGIRLFAFIAAILSILALIGFFLPSARIQINRKKELQQLDLRVLASPENSLPSRSGAIPAYLLSVIVESSQQRVSIGTVTIPGEKAKGVVRFSNMTDQMVTIPEGTVVQTLATTPVSFRTDQQVVIPPDLNEYMEVPVTAVEGGEDGNVNAGEIAMIESETGVKIFVTNLMPTSGGTNIAIPAPTQEDYSQLREDLIQELPTLALSEFQSKISEDMRLISTSLYLDTIESEVQDPQAGSPGDMYKMTIRAKYSVWYISNADIDKVSNLAMDATISSDYQVVPDSLSVIPLEEPVFENGRVTWDLHLAREIVRNYAVETLASNLIGLRPESARQTLMNSLDLEDNPLITIFPRWFPFLPFLSFRIEVNWS